MKPSCLNWLPGLIKAISVARKDDFFTETQNKAKNYAQVATPLMQLNLDLPIEQLSDETYQMHATVREPVYRGY